eukprot:441452-Pyramimonas_sp.AAC.2
MSALAAALAAATGSRGTESSRSRKLLLRPALGVRGLELLRTRPSGAGVFSMGPTLMAPGAVRSVRAISGERGFSILARWTLRCVSARFVHA